ncbi:acyl-CoA N-acyltransferase [Amylostereum chailletii]|nr:acyl-CoA N-acyltransferase [Amylostereum chailletii]
MQFRTARTILRTYEPHDVKKLFSLWNDPEIQRLVFNDYTVPFGLKAIEKRIALLRKSPSFFAIIENKVTGEFMGHVGLSIHNQKNKDGVVSITFARPYWSNGYGTEVMQWLVGYGFRDVHLRRISLNVFEENVRAIALYRKIGFIHEGMSRQSNWVQGKWMGAILMGLLVEEWDMEKGMRREVP